VSPSLKLLDHLGLIEIEPKIGIMNLGNLHERARSYKGAPTGELSMRTTIVAMLVASGTMIALPVMAQQQTAPNQQQKQQMQDEADRGAKTRQSGESGYVGLEEKPGSSAQAPGRADTAPPAQTTGEASRDPTVQEMNVKEKDKVDRTGK
jgi:hypothetical protein